MALTKTLPKPSSYSETSINPPVGKSGKRAKDFPLKKAFSASIISRILWGKIFVDIPTAIPSAPIARITGSLALKTKVSLFLPS